MFPGIFEGTNATVFAYGATGSGKTYTMQVPYAPVTLVCLTKCLFWQLNPSLKPGCVHAMQGTDDCPGLIPLAVSTILARCTGTWCSVEISYYEVYMERCYDLLEPKAKEIMALDDKDGNLQLKGLCWVMCWGFGDW